MAAVFCCILHPSLRREGEREITGTERRGREGKHERYRERVRECENERESERERDTCLEVIAFPPPYAPIGRTTTT